MAEDANPDLNMLTVQLLSAYVANNTVPREDLVELIRSTRAALDEPVKEVAPVAEPAPVAAVSVRKSLASPDHILSMIDGKPYKTMKRHLATHGMTPDEYREKFGLPKTYPMVAPNYSERRRAVAKEVGLGRKRLDEKAERNASAVKAEAEKPAAEKAAPGKPASAKSAPAKSAPAKSTKAPARKPRAAAAETAASTPATPQARTSDGGKGNGGKRNGKSTTLKIRTARKPAPGKAE